MKPEASSLLHGSWCWLVCGCSCTSGCFHTDQLNQTSHSRAGLSQLPHKTWLQLLPRCHSCYSKDQWTHRALLVALGGEIWAEEKVGDGHQQRLSQWPSFIVIFTIVVQTLEERETSSEVSRDTVTFRREARATRKLNDSLQNHKLNLYDYKQTTRLFLLLLLSPTLSLRDIQSLLNSTTGHRQGGGGGGRGTDTMWTVFGLWSPVDPVTREPAAVRTERGGGGCGQWPRQHQQVPLSLWRSDRTITEEPALRNHHWGTTTEEPALRNHHWGTSTEEPSLRNHHWGTSTEEPSLRNHHWGTITEEPSLRNHHWGTITEEPALRNQHWGTSTEEPSLRNHHWGTTTEEPSLRNHHWGTITEEPLLMHWTFLDLHRAHEIISCLQQVEQEMISWAQCLWRTRWRLHMVWESYPSSASSGHSGPEEAPPVGVLEDVRQDAREQAGAVQDDVALLLRGAARVRALDQPLHGLRTQTSGVRLRGDV